MNICEFRPISPTIKRQMTSVICLFIMIDFEFGREPTRSGALLKVRAHPILPFPSTNGRGAGVRGQPAGLPRRYRSSQ